ncbi:MAG: Bro-N domain-containing protein, partial [Oscillospiraceae bacterium]
VAKRHLPTDSGIQELNVIPEGDVYRLITRSKLPSAEKFERWLFDEVVPSVVHTGSYGQAAMDMKMLTQVATTVCAEMIKQLLPLINSKQQAAAQQQAETDTIEFLDEPRRKRKQFSVISKLSVDIRQEVEEMLCSGNYSYTDIVNYLATKGIKLSIMSVSRYAHRNGCYEE